MTTATSTSGSAPGTRARRTTRISTSPLSPRPPLGRAGRQSSAPTLLNAKIEGSSADGYEQLTVPIIASTLALVPGAALLIATCISNERTLLSLLEAGKIFLVLDGILLLISVVEVNRLTFDCRWYTDNLHNNRVACKSGQQKVMAGAILLFICEGVLCLGILIFLELERKRVRENSGGGGFGTSIGANVPQLEVRQMSTQPVAGWGFGNRNRALPVDTQPGLSMGSNPTRMSNTRAVDLNTFSNKAVPEGWGETQRPPGNGTGQMQMESMRPTPNKNEMNVEAMNLPPANGPDDAPSEGAAAQGGNSKAIEGAHVGSGTGVAMEKPAAGIEEAGGIGSD